MLCWKEINEIEIGDWDRMTLQMQLAVQIMNVYIHWYVYINWRTAKIQGFQNMNVIYPLERGIQSYIYDIPTHIHETVAIEIYINWRTAKSWFFFVMDNAHQMQLAVREFMHVFKMLLYVYVHMYAPNSMVCRSPKLAFGSILLLQMDAKISDYGVATISRLLKITGLFCGISSL